MFYFRTILFLNSIGRGFFPTVTLTELLIFLVMEICSKSSKYLKCNSFIFNKLNKIPFCFVFCSVTDNQVVLVNYSREFASNALMLAKEPIGVQD